MRISDLLSFRAGIGLVVVLALLAPLAMSQQPAEPGGREAVKIVFNDGSVHNAPWPEPLGIEGDDPVDRVGRARAASVEGGLDRLGLGADPADVEHGRRG